MSPDLAPTLQIILEILTLFVSVGGIVRLDHPRVPRPDRYVAGDTGLRADPKRRRADDWLGLVSICFSLPC